MPFEIVRNDITNMRVEANPKDHLQAWMICPDPEVQLQMHRLYLQKAKEALKEAKKIK